MGCKPSKPAQRHKTSHNNTRPIFHPPPGVPGSNFYFRNEEKNTDIRVPGYYLYLLNSSLYMQSFEITNCSGCNYFICDATSATYITKCEKCNIVIGPTEATISVKDCKDCKFILAAKEVRATCVTDCDFLLYSKEKPSLEKCENLKFGCYDFSYFEMASIFFFIIRTNGIMSFTFME